MGNVMAYSGLTTKIRAMQAKLLTQADYETIAGWILELCDSVPDIGEVFEVEGYKFKVQSMRGQRISLIRVIAPADTDKTESGQEAVATAGAEGGTMPPAHIDGDE